MTEYRVDDLARAAGTTVRNVRVYQDRGLLPPPRREGRVGVYTDAHLARLRLVGQLLDRGYTLQHIRELIEAWQRGRNLTDLLGLEEVLTTPWSDEIPDYLTSDQLVAMFGEQATPESLARAGRLGVLEAEGDRFKVPSPRLLQAGAELVSAGVPLPAVLDLEEALAADLEAVAGRLVDTAANYLVGPAADTSPDDEQLARLAQVIRRVRPLAQMAIDALLARAMERQVNEAMQARLAALAQTDGAGAEAS